MNSSFLNELFNHYLGDRSNFAPYIGANYLISRPKTLVIGEVFNLKIESSKSSDSPSSKMAYSTYIFRDKENAACRNLCQTLLNFDQSLSEDKIAFTFFIHRHEHGSASVRLNYSKKELDEAIEDLVTLLELIKPERIVYYGSQTKRTVERRSTQKVRGTSFAEYLQRIPKEPEIIPLRVSRNSEDQYREKIEEGKSVLQDMSNLVLGSAGMAAGSIVGASVLPIAGLFSSIGISLGVLGKTLLKINEYASKGDIEAIKGIVSSDVSKKIGESSEAFMDLARTTQESISQTDPNSMSLKIELVKNLVREMQPNSEHPRGRVMSVQMVGQRLNDNNPPLLTATGKPYDIKSRGVGILLGTIYHILAESEFQEDRIIAEQMKSSFTTRNAVKIFERDQVLEDEYWSPQNKPQRN